MGKFSLNNLFEDKTFIVSGREGRVYFVEESTGRICFIYRFATEGDREHELNWHHTSDMYLFLLGLPAIFVWRAAAPYLYTLYSHYSSVVNNILLLVGLTILLAPLSLWVSQNLNKKAFEGYQKAAKKNSPIFIEDSKKLDVLKQARGRRRLMFAIYAVLLLPMIGTGYHFAVATNMEALIIPPGCAAMLLMLTINLKDRRISRKLTRKMWSDLKREQGG